jgi:hypothetical protein
MTVGLILEFQGVDQSQYDAVNGKLGIDPKSGKGDWPAGILSHVGATTDDGGLVVIELWDSKDSQESFMNGRLGKALGEVGVPAPVRVTWFDVIAQHTT